MGEQAWLIAASYAVVLPLLRCAVSENCLLTMCGTDGPRAGTPNI